MQQLQHSPTPTTLLNDDGLASQPSPAKSRYTYTYSFSENTSVTLDLIRAISAQMVLVGHAISFFNIATWLHEPNFPWMQNIGVLVFFLLSGFLITYSSCRKMERGTYNLKLFLIERFSRIYSGYVPAMILVVLIDLVFLAVHGRDQFPYGLDLKAFIGNLLMLQDFPLFQKEIAVTSPGSARPFWTLAVEWWIYLFFGWMVLGKTVTRRSLVYISVLSVLAVVPFFNSVVAGRGNGLFVVWMMGFVVAILLNGAPRLPAPKTSALFSIALMALGFLRAYQVRTAYDLTFAALLMGSLFFLIGGLDAVPSFYSAHVKRAIKLLADYSFSLYLVHYSILFFLAPMMATVSPYTLFLAGLIGSNAIALIAAIPTEMRHRELTRWLSARIW